MRHLPLVILLAAQLAGCALFPPLPPQTPLAVSLRRYQACVAQSQRNLNICEPARLAYEAQLNRAEK